MGRCLGENIEGLSVRVNQTINVYAGMSHSKRGIILCIIYVQLFHIQLYCHCSFNTFSLIKCLSYEV